ncbi:tetratricopeptide repeat protein [Noviherbaspirillum galbum]|uniref:Sel1 repeat family protein n=1 Tax=Noviherbaspirillum galbum TaxID=2709383 RepID=A0A6B3SRR4_9BURK|nr:tetratricopeptide repeat protein [Noviherbaspirillum galbum]NEX63384.1 sel1 repeat family protein [Noviherbaspirillum galbum]
MTKRRILLLGLLGACLAAPGTAQTIPFLDGGQKRAYDLSRAAATGSEAALEELRSRANDGDRWSAMQFGWLHHTGKAPKAGRDIKIAMKAYRKAAKIASDSAAITGNPLAAYNMGLIYLYGDDGVESDPHEAAKWFSAAAGDETKVFVPAAMNLANLFEYGFGNVAQDLAESARWYRAAAAHKEPYALYKLGAMLANGIGVAANPFEAQIKLEAAAKMGSTDAMYILSRLSMVDHGLTEKNPVNAAKWLLIASENNPQFKKLANEAMSKLPRDKQNSAKNMAMAWLKSYGRPMPRTDYRVPLNTLTQ